jgi:CBS domain-containing protein
MPVETLAVKPVVAEPHTPAIRIAELLRDEEVGSVVIEEAGRPVGIITDRDIAVAVADHEDISGLEASDLMTEDPVTIEGDAEAVELPEKMAETHARRIPVVDDGKLVGVATLDDVVATTGEELEDIAEVIEAQSPEYSP